MKLILHAVYLVLGSLLKNIAAMTALGAIVCGISWALVSHPYIFIPTVVICIFLIMVVFKVVDLKDLETLERKSEESK